MPPRKRLSKTSSLRSDEGRDSEPKEEELYEPIKNDLIQLIGEDNCYIEITARGKISNDLKRTLTDLMLHIIDVERFTPDLMGIIHGGNVPINPETSPKIIVEVKNEEISLKDVFQTTNYGEIFEAEYALLISTKPLPETIRRFLWKKPNLQSYWDRKSIKIAQFNIITNVINWLSWYPEKPFDTVRPTRRI